MGGVVKAVTSAVSGVVSGVKQTVSGGSDGGGGLLGCATKAVKNIGNAVSNIVKNPLPVIEAAAITWAVGPEGLALTSSAPAAAAISSAAVSAANGGNVGDIATAAITSGVGSYAGQAAGTAIGADTTPGQLTTLGKITSSAVGGSTTTTLKALADGSSLSDALSAGAKTFAAAGITSGAIEGIKAGFDPGTTAGTAPVVERSTGPGVDPTDATDTASSQNFPISPEVAAGKDPLSDPTIGPTEQKLLSSALYPAVYSTLFGKQQQAPVSAVTGTTTTQAPTQQQPISPVQTTAGPGTQALAQALRIGDAGAPIFGGDKEEGKKAGWNVESLRYMGNSEA